MPLYDPSDLPSTTTWINRLSAVQAYEQCQNLGIQPATTLEANRVLLRDFVRGQRQQASQTQNSYATQGMPQGVAPTPPVSATPTNLDLLSQISSFQQETSADDWNTQPTQMTVDRTLTQALGNQNSHPKSVIPGPLIDLVTPAVSSNHLLSEELLQQMRSLNMEAISQTVQAVVGQIVNRPEFCSNRQSEYNDSNIPHFVREMLKDLPKADGTDLTTTLRFLAVLTRLLDLNLAPERAILLNATAYTTSRFREFWIETIPHTSSWQALLAQFREKFLTPDILRRAQDQFLYRTQKNSEQLAEFAKDIQSFYRILSPHTDSLTVFQTIFCRINPETRNALTGISPLNTVHDLISASPFAASVKEQNFSSGNQNLHSNSQGYNPHLQRKNFQQPQHPHYRDSRPNNPTNYRPRFQNQNPSFQQYPHSYQQFQVPPPMPYYPQQPFHAPQQVPAPRPPRNEFRNRYHQGWQGQNSYRPNNQQRPSPGGQQIPQSPAPNSNAPGSQVNPTPGFTPGYMDNSPATQQQLNS